MQELGIWVQIATLGIFLCTALATIFSVRAARSAIRVASRESRPWIFPVRINTYLHKDMMTSKVEITNGGKIPGFAKLSIHMKVGPETKKPDETEPGLSIIIPDQIVKTSFAVKGASYQAVLKGEKDLVIHLELQYSDEKENISKYSSRTTWEFQPTLIPSNWDKVSPIEMAAIWTVTDADMK